MTPNDDETRAALYNMGCALAKQRKWAEAAESIVKAINDYSLKLSVALKDDDLQELRERREWLDALVTVKGGVSQTSKVDLRTEAKAPFRLPRLILAGGLLAGASIGLLVIGTRLIRALQGGEGAPDLPETLQNLAINVAAVALLGAVVVNDVRSKQKDVQITTREETLGMLQLDLGGDRVLPLAKFRGQVRPVIVAGNRAFVDKALKEAEKQYTSLRERGVSVVPVVFDAPGSPPGSAKELDPEEKIRALKRELGGVAKDGKGFSDAKKAPPAEAPRKKERAVSLVDADKKWRLQPHDDQEWKNWLMAQQEFANLPAAEPNCFIQVQLDGTVRTSGRGAPPWAKLVDDLPPISDMRTRLMDGVGPSD